MLMLSEAERGSWEERVMGWRGQKEKDRWGKKKDKEEKIKEGK